MKKEVIIAIVLGLLVGLIVTFATYIIRRDNSQDEQNRQIVDRILLDPIDTANGDPTAGQKVKIMSPVDESVQTEKKIQLSGYGLPASLLVVFVNDQETILNLEDQPEFSLETDLESGSNVISIHAVAEDGQTYSDQITVIYTNKSLEEKLVSDQEVKDAAQAQAK